MKSKWSNNYLLVLLVISFLIINRLGAVIVQVDHLSRGDQNYYVFFEQHLFMNPADSKQADSLDRILPGLSASEKPLKVFVEVPGRISCVPRWKKVTTYIMDVAKKYPGIIAEDIEVRGKSGLAHYIFSQSYNSYFANDCYEVCGQPIDIKSVTFNDFFDELNEKGTSDAKTLGNFLSRTLVFDKWVSIGRARSRLSDYMKEHGIDGDTPLIKAVGSLPSEIKKKLFRGISDTFSNLFDLHAVQVLKNCLESDEVSNFAFFIGSEHARWICTFLKSISDTQSKNSISSTSPDQIFSVLL